MSNPHPDVVATNAWLEQSFGLERLVERLEQAAGSVLEAERAVIHASAELRLAEERLADREAELAYPILTDPANKNAAARDAQVGRLARADADWCRLRREVETRRTELAGARAEVGRRENHQKNLRVKAEVVAARLRAIAR